MEIKIITVIIGILGMVCSMTSLAQAQDEGPKELNVKQQSIVTIAAFTASGDLEKLKTALREGLEAGLTVNEIKEILVHLYAYCGFPRSLNGLNTFRTILEEREQQGIKDEIGREASPLPTDKSSVELGAQNLYILQGKPDQKFAYSFSSAMEKFLLGHLFGDIFGRDVLDFQSREITTISALASMQIAQLRSHLNVGMNVGLTETELRSLIAVLEANVGKEESAYANETLDRVLRDRAN